MRPRFIQPILLKTHFFRFLDECNTTHTAWWDPAPTTTFDRSHHPIHAYLIIKRLLQKWPNYLTQIEDELPTSKQSVHFHALLNDFVWTDGNFGHRVVTTFDLKSLERAIKSSFSLYELWNKLSFDDYHDNILSEILDQEIDDTKNKKEELLCARNESESVLQPWHHCIYERKFVPYIRCKVEIFSSEPSIKLYHEMYSEKERMDILNEAAILLNESKLYVRGTHVGKTATNFRTSASAWLSPNRYRSVDDLYKRVAFWSGLEVGVYTKSSAAERLQVVNYGIGGRFITHHDYWDELKMGKRVDAPFLQGSGERLSTWMFYFSEPEVGGATVFTEIGLKVKPKLGSVLVWDNLKLDGSYETLSRHAGCPVALGQKWIGNIWIRTNPQMFRRPCPVDFR